MSEQKDHKKITKPVSGSVFDEMPAKFAFWSGLVTGAAVLSLLTVIIMLVLMFRGVDLTPSDNTASDTTTDAVAAEAPTAAPTPAAAPTAAAAPASGNVDIEASKNKRGNGSVAIVEFSDFDCPFCARFNPTMDQVREKYGDDVTQVFKHFPLTNIHPQAVEDAIAAECAGDQGKFFEMKDELFDKQDLKGEDAILDIASDLGLDIPAFESCIADEDNVKSDLVEADAAEGQSLGCTGTPCPLLVVDGEVKQQFRGAVPFETIDAALAEYVE
jgi:protein-disulfide isomerase